jgi:hypothetical protein
MGHAFFECSLLIRLQSYKPFSRRSMVSSNPSHSSCLDLPLSQSLAISSHRQQCFPTHQASREGDSASIFLLQRAICRKQQQNFAPLEKLVGPFLDTGRLRPTLPTRPRTRVTPPNSAQSTRRLLLNARLPSYRSALRSYQCLKPSNPQKCNRRRSLLLSHW